MKDAPVMPVNIKKVDIKRMAWSRTALACEKVTRFIEVKKSAKNITGMRVVRQVIKCGYQQETCGTFSRADVTIDEGRPAYWIFRP